MLLIINTLIINSYYFNVIFITITIIVNITRFTTVSRQKPIYLMML